MKLNYRKVMVAGATAAVIVGAGGTALAVPGSSTTPGTPGTPGKAGHTAGQKAGKHKHGKGHGDAKMLRRLEHGQFVAQGKDGKAVTHDVIRGTVTSVSSTSIIVRAADKTSEKFTVTKDTKVREHIKGQKPATPGQKPAPATIAKIAKGDHVFVSGTGTGTPTAERIVESAAK
ncbi:MAG: hypothetical protein ACR2LX_06820 [Jatrophihabitans sp.]